jgi:dihydrodipicolinate synthase/N-acetylneuraminate lyase
MKTNAVTPADLAASVLSVPPLCREADFGLSRAQNIRLLAHLRSRGVSTFMYGGNANLYHMAPSEFIRFADLIQDIADDADWIIPSVGSDFGKASDQLAFLRGEDFPTAMVLPHRFPFTPAGIATGLRKLADIYGRPIIAYVKDEGFIEPRDLAKLVSDGAVCAIKYAIVRADPKADPFLDELLQHVDRNLVISGIGERPAIAHLTHYRLGAFTSGSVCVAPALSTALLHALQRGDIKGAEGLRSFFIPLEDLRDKHSPLRVLHAAVALTGIAATGPLLPFLSRIEDRALLEAIGEEARKLYEFDRRAASLAA